MKFWLFVGGAGLAVAAGIRDLHDTLDWWGVRYRTCGFDCVITPSPSTQGVQGVTYIVAMFALGAVLAWLAVRTRRRAALRAVERPDFDVYRKALREHGFREADSRRHPAAFGSWLIDFDDPRARVVWDGKEGSLLVQKQAQGTWADLWIGRNEVNQTPDAVAAQLALLK